MSTLCIRIRILIHPETSGKIVGEEGDFFKLPVVLQRDSEYYAYAKEERFLYE